MEKVKLRCWSSLYQVWSN